VAAGDAALELVGGALGDQPAVVQQRDLVGELVGLLQVLGGEQDRGSAGHQVADDLPHGAAAARVQAGGRLVQEEDARVADQAHRQVEPAPHAAGVGGGRLPGRLGQVEPVQQLGGAPPAFAPAQVAEVGHQGEVLLAGEQVVHRGELAGDADHLADRVGVPGHVVARDAHLATVGADQGGQDVHGGGLAGAVGAQQRKDRSLGNAQVDAVQHHLVAERLAQPGYRDRRLGWGGRHTPSPRRCGPGGHDRAEHARPEVHRGFTAVSGARPIRERTPSFSGRRARIASARSRRRRRGCTLGAAAAAPAITLEPTTPALLSA
jgi:hypothetical protein